MLTRATCIIFLILACLASLHSQTPRARHSVMLLGNLADIEDKSAYGASLQQLVNENPHTRAILISGDLVNPSKSFRDEIDGIHHFLEELKELPVRVIFLPGDRDWDNNDVNGLEMVQLIEDLVDNGNFDNVEWPLRNGCPGPEQIRIASDLSILAINTQWWNHKYEKPTPETAICDIASDESFFEELEDLIENSTAGNLVIAGHHPLISNGKYGGRFPLKDWLFPIPLVSSMKTAFRQNIGNIYETVNERYEPFREKMFEVFADHFSMIYISGHEHNIEVLRDRQNVHINSGAPSKKGFVARAGNTAYAADGPGILSLYFDNDGAAYTIMHTYTENGFAYGPEAMVFQPPCQDPDPKIAINERLVPCLEVANVLPEMQNTYEKERITIANPTYQAKGLKKFFLGQHYRDSWTTPVTVPLLDLDLVHGGLIPYQMGGGRQTVNLKFKAGNGLEYAYRSVDKDPGRGLHPELRSTLLSVVLRDQTTSQQPYGALTVSHLLDQTNILHPRPHLYIMPDDPKLGPFQPMFGNMLGMLEERPTDGEGKEETIYGADEIRQTIRMFRDIYQDPANRIAIDEYLQARLFDIWIGDWGRHEDNWKWAGYQQDDGGMLYRPIPVDRDHAFSLWDGFFPWLADREWASESGESFEYKIKGLRSLTWQSRHMDRFLATEMDKQDWINAAKKLKQTFNDSLIAAAVQRMPAAIVEIDGKEIREKLKARLRDLDTYAEAYYALLAKEIDLPGTVKDEYFEVIRNPDGSVQVKISPLDGERKGEPFYERRFLPAETNEIRLFGLRGDDKFVLEGSSKNSIPVRIIPGSGIDYIRDESDVDRGKKQTIIYDDENIDPIIPGNETKLAKTKNADAFRYRRNAFTYNTYFPLTYLYFTGDDGLIFKGGIRFTRQAYGKEDFSSTHKLSAGVSTIGNLLFEYEGLWHHVFGRWDVIAGAITEERKRFRYFFGEGNNTTYEKALLRSGFYTLQYETLKINGGVMNTFWKRSHFLGMLGLERNTAQKNKNTILDLETENVLGRDALTIAKAQIELDLDFRNREHLPTSGMRFYTNHMAGFLLNQEQTLYVVNRTEMEYFGTTRPFTLGLRAGLMLHYGAVPFYDRYYIGQNSHLRGFRRNRFTSERMIYVNSDLRIELLKKNSALVPYQFGVKLFADAGRISVEDSALNKWHLGFGGGIYFAPIRERFVFNLLLGYSEEDRGLLILSFGRDF